MIKKLLVIPILVFILSGCGEKESVTADMLVGEWNCKDMTTRGIAYVENEKVLIDQDLRPSNEYRLSYIKNGDKLMKAKNAGEPKDTDFKVKMDYDFFPLGNTSHESNFGYEYIFISANEFKIITQSVIRDIDSKQKIIENYSEEVC